MHKRHRLLCLILVSTMLLAVLPAGAYGEGINQKSDWAAESIEMANCGGILSREQYLGDFTRPIMRYEIAELIAKAYENVTEEPYYANQAPFTDGSSSYISTVYELGIMNGKGEDIFAPYDYATREEMAKIILTFKAVAQGEPLILPDVVEPVFADFDRISDWAKPYVVKAGTEGIINGYDDGTFGGSNTVSWEAAVALVTRAVRLNQKEKPVITSLAWDSVIPSGEDLEIRMASYGRYELYAKKCDGYGYGYNGSLAIFTDESLTLYGGNLEPNSVYYIYAESDGVYSDPIRIYTDQYKLVMNLDSFAPAGPVTVSWNRLPGVEVYYVKVTEERPSYYDEDIPPNGTRTYEIRWEDFYTFQTNPNRVYTVEIVAGDYYASQDIYIEMNPNDGAMEIANNYPETKEAADALMKTITVPVWKIKNGQKVSSTASLTVHYAIAERVKLVFEEIYNGSEKFPIKDVGGYSWRGGRSEHNGGTAIDINANENYCIYSNGTTIGSYWKPYEDPYSITPYGEVIRAFEKYGFTWGGDAWSNPKDYMHFSYLGT